MKFEFNWPSGSEKTMFKYVKWATLAERSKVNLNLWNLFNHTRLNISSENNDFGFHRIQKTTFQKKIHLKALGSKFDLDVK